MCCGGTRKETVAPSYPHTISSEVAVMTSMWTCSRTGACPSISSTMFTQQKYSYSQLGQSEVLPSDCQPSPSSPRSMSSWTVVRNVAGFACWTALTIAIGFAFGVFASTSHAAASSHIPLPSSPNTFKYNRTFADLPSDISNRAWKSLFPANGGFFNVSKMSNERSTLSVFHQLHCLDGIRHGYWSLYLAVNYNISLVEGSMPEMESPAHIRHCIDLLRQSLMCNADTTLEIKEEQVNGVHGFGTTHQCSDWAHLLRVISEKQSG